MLHPLLERVHREVWTKESLDALLNAGAEGKRAITGGMTEDDYKMRIACTLLLDHNADNSCIEALLRATHDGHQRVRRAAFHSLSCQRCKPAPLSIDTLPLLLDALQNDRSVKVRRSLAAHLADLPQDPRAIAPLHAALRKATDEKLRIRLLTAIAHHTAPEKAELACAVAPQH